MQPAGCQGDLAEGLAPSTVKGDVPPRQSAAIRRQGLKHPIRCCGTLSLDSTVVAAGSASSCVARSITICPYGGQCTGDEPWAGPAVAA